jgi:CheY-like chemotaxis protein
MAIVGTCSGTNVRFDCKVPVVRDGFEKRQLIRLVESAVKPRVRILMVMANPNADLSYERFGGPKLEGPKIKGYGQMWHLVTSYPETFEIELETNGTDALEGYRARGPYDMVLAELRLPGLAGTELAKAIRSEGPSQRIVMITNSASVGRHVLQELGDVPVFNFAKTRAREAANRALTKQWEDGEGRALIARAEAGVAAQLARKRHALRQV